MVRGCLTMTLSLLLISCGGSVPGLILGDPSSEVEPLPGWSARNCEGTAPLICVTGPGGEVGLVELLRFSSSHDSLEALASDFVASIASDRAEGCGPDYEVEPIPPTEADVAGERGLRFGFVGLTGEGVVSERNIQHAFIDGADVVVLAAAAYAAGGCPGRDELPSFEPDALEAFDPGLSELVAGLKLP